MVAIATKVFALFIDLSGKNMSCRESSGLKCVHEITYHRLFVAFVTFFEVIQ